MGSTAIGLTTGTLLRRLGELPFAAYGTAMTGAAVALRSIPDDTIALACSTAIGLGLPCALTATLTLLQHETPPALLGRATATAHTLLFAPTALGMAIGAEVVDLVDLRAPVGGIGLGLRTVRGVAAGDRRERGGDVRGVLP